MKFIEHLLCTRDCVRALPILALLLLPTFENGETEVQGRQVVCLEPVLPAPRGSTGRQGSGLSLRVSIAAGLRGLAAVPQVGSDTVITIYSAVGSE